MADVLRLVQFGRTLLLTTSPDTTTCYLFTTCYFVVSIRYSLLSAYCSLLTTHYPLLTILYSLPTTHCSPLTTHYLLLTTHDSPLTTHLSLLTTLCSPLTTHLLPLTSLCSHLSARHYSQELLPMVKHQPRTAWLARCTSLKQSFPFQYTPAREGKIKTQQASSRSVAGQ